MWLFGRKTKSPDQSGSRGTLGMQIVRRTEITVDREWTETVVRKRPEAGTPVDAAGQVIDAEFREGE